MLELDEVHEQLTGIYADGSVEGYSLKHLGAKMCVLPMSCVLCTALYITLKLVVDPSKAQD